MCKPGLQSTLKTVLRLGICLAVAAALAGLAANAQETIDATAMGTSTQMGKNVSIKLIITAYSTPEDKQDPRRRIRQGPESGTG